MLGRVSETVSDFFFFFTQPVGRVRQKQHDKRQFRIFDCAQHNRNTNK